jgi:hypothetical protein
MKRKFLVLVLLASLVLMPFGFNKTRAAALTTVTGGSYAVGATAQITVDFNVVTTINTGKVIEVMMDSTAIASGTVTTANVTVTRLSGSGTIGTWTIDTSTTGYVRATAGAAVSLTAAGNDVVRVTIGGATAPTQYTLTATAGNYNVSVATTDDTGAGLVYIGDENDVNVTATVPPTIDMELYANNTDGTLQPGNPNTCSIGVLTLSTVKTCAYWIGSATNSASGVTVRVQDTGANAGLAKGAGATNNVDNVTANTATLTPGTEQYGFRITTAGSYTASAATAGTYASGYQPVPVAATSFATRNNVHNTIGTNNPGERLQVTHAATMSASTEVGSYSNAVTFTAYTN